MSYVPSYTWDDTNLWDRERIVLPLWRSMHSLNLMLPKEERKAMLLRIYNDNSELIDHSKNRDREAKAREAEAEAQVPATSGADDDGGVRLDAKDPAVVKAEEPSSETVIGATEKTEPAEAEKMETAA